MSINEIDTCFATFIKGKLKHLKIDSVDLIVNVNGIT